MDTHTHTERERERSAIVIPYEGKMNSLVVEEAQKVRHVSVVVEAFVVLLSFFFVLNAPPACHHEGVTVSASI